MSVNVCQDNISDRSNVIIMVMIIISKSIIQKYHFAMFKVKAIVSTTVYKVQNKLVQLPSLPTPYPHSYLEKKTKEKKRVIYFVHVCTSKKTF